jgi:hypothetical protein
MPTVFNLASYDSGTARSLPLTGSPKLVPPRTLTLMTSTCRARSRDMFSTPEVPSVSCDRQMEPLSTLMVVQLQPLPRQWRQRQSLSQVFSMVLEPLPSATAGRSQDPSEILFALAFSGTRTAALSISMYLVRFPCSQFLKQSTCGVKSRGIIETSWTILATVSCGRLIARFPHSIRLDRLTRKLPAST